jgi:ribosomal protein L18
MPVLYTNNASTTLGSSLLIDATSLTVASGSGALFPVTTTGYFYASIVNASNQIEFVKVTARSSDVFTIVRGQNGSTARAYAAGDKVELRLIAAALENFLQLDGAQTVTGAKTFSGATALSGGGAMAGTFTGDPTFSGAPVFSGASQVSGSINLLSTGSLNTTNFKIMQESGKLVIKYGSNVVLSVASNGDVISAQNITAYGTP